MRNAVALIRSNPGLVLVVVIGLASVAVRVLLMSEFGTSALLYIAVPFVVTVTLLLADPGQHGHWTLRYYRGFRATFLVLFAVSIVLYEGIVCVLMFLPIYLVFALFAMLSEGIWRAVRHLRHGRVGAFALPLLVLAGSLEGTRPEWSFERYNEVRVTRTVPLPATEVRANFGEPFDLRADRGWFLNIFPMPDRIGAREMLPGEIHEVHYTYKRWLITNVHEGRMLLEVTDIGNHHLTTTVLEDTSYISHYLKLHGTRIILEPLDASTTRVTLTVRYDRKLDPAWYFGPLQRYGVGRMADHLIDEMIVR